MKTLLYDPKYSKSIHWEKVSRSRTAAATQPKSSASWGYPAYFEKLTWPSKPSRRAPPHRFWRVLFGSHATAVAGTDFASVGILSH